MDTPKPFILKTPSVLVIQEGGGCLAFFGLPFLAAGIWIAAISLGFTRVNNAQDMPFVVSLAMFLFGLVFAGVGGSLVFGRRWISIDTLQRRVTEQYGLIVPIKSRSESLDAYVGVSLGFLEGDSDSADRYPLALTCRNNKKALRITSMLQYKEAMAQATFLASFLHLPLEDQTTDKVMVTKPWQSSTHALAQVDEAQTIDDHRPVRRPVGCRSLIEDKATGLKISVPMPQVPFGAIVFALVPAAILAWFVYSSGIRFTNVQLSKDLLNYHSVENVFSSVFIIVFSIFALNITIRPIVYFLKIYRKSQNGMLCVMISRNELVIDDRGDKQRGIPLDAVLSVEASQRGVSEERGRHPSSRARMKGVLAYLAQHKDTVLRIKTNADILAFKLGVSYDETVYLADLITRRIASYR